MKKILALLLFSVALFVCSCNHTQDMDDITFKDSTYVNDFAGLMNVVNNNDSVLAARFDALNKLLEADIADITLAIDSNTSVITILNQTTKNGLDSVKNGIFNGFNVLTVHIDAQRDSIVNAMNKDGEGLRLQIDNTGKLISGDIQTYTESQKSVHDAIDTLTSTYAKGVMTPDKYLTQLLNARTILCTMDTTKFKELVTLLDGSLKKGGVTIGSDKKSLVLTQEVWKLAEDKDSSSVFYLALNGAIRDLTDKDFRPTFSATKWIGCDAKENDIATFTGPSPLGGSNKYYALLLDSDPYQDAETGKTVVKVVKTYGYYQYALQPTATVSSNTYKYYCVRTYDARGDYQVYAKKDGIGPRAKVDGKAAEDIATSTAINTSINVIFKVTDKGKIYKDAYKVYAFEWHDASPSQFCLLFWPSEK